jgi:anti-sigma B factor antagonist
MNSRNFAARAGRWSAEHRAEPETAPAPEPVAAGSPLAIEVERRGARTRVELTGELDMTTVGMLEARLVQLESESPRLIVLDLRRLAFMDSTGLHAIVAAVRRGRAEDRRVALIKSGGPLDRVLLVARAQDIVETVDDPAAVGFGAGQE